MERYWMIFYVLFYLLLPDAYVYAKDSTQSPRFLSKLISKDTVVNEGQVKILECQAIGHPKPKYKWLKDWQPLGEYTEEYFYKINDVSKEDGGDYRCLAENLAGVILTAKMTVRVAYMNEANLTIEEVRVASGEAAIISLPQVESYPSPSVTWYSGSLDFLYDVKYAITEPENNLIILDVGSEDVRTYSARITNTQSGKDFITPDISLIVEGGSAPEEIPPTIIIPPANMSIVKGTSISLLQCIANARPLYQLETLWFKDDVPIKRSGIKHFSDQWNRTLSLLDADLHYSGVYKCEVRLRDSLSPYETAEAVITVSASPTLKKLLPEVTEVDLGKVVMLPCDGVAAPEPFVRWFRNAVDVKDIDDSRYRVLGNGSLAISSVRIADSGCIQCLASNSAGEISTYTWLKVKTSAPVMTTGPTNRTALVGQEALMPCRAKGAPMPNTTWFFKGEELVETSHYHIGLHGDLEIVGVEPWDGGEYLCVKTNEAGVVNGTAWLSILVKTKIIQGPVDMRVILGHVALMQCQLTHAKSVDVRIQWFHDGSVMAPDPYSRISIRRDGTLQIQEARAADVGLYTCRVTSLGGNDTKSARLEVIELPYAPVAVGAIRAPHQRKTAQVTWTPTFDGNSPITKFIIYAREVPSAGIETDLGLNWEKALDNVTVGSHSAHVSNLRPSTGYQFRVSAVNNVGEGPPSNPSDVLILPQEAPSAPPRGLVGSPRSPSEIMIQWKAPKEEDRNGRLLGYLVKYRLWGYANSQYYFKNITNESQRNYLVGGLITWKDYEIKVAAYNIKGVGAYSAPITVKTKEGVPQAPPRNVTARAVGSTLARVSWRPPPPYLINGINQGYKLQAWRDVPENVTEPEVTVTVTPSPYPDAKEEASITGLQKYTKYFITVLCFTHPGDGNRSKPVELTTLEDVPDPVVNLRFEDVSDRYVKVTWSAPERQNGILKGYTLSYRKKGLPSTLITHNLTADVTSFSISNLTATTFYTFEVFAWTSVGPGAPLVVTIQSGVEPVLPDSPSRLAVSNIQPFSVVLQFTPGFDGNASIDEWRVEAHSHRTNAWELVQESSAPDANTLTVGGLVPFSKYQLRLTAVNIVGLSPPSAPSPEFQTLQALPAHPPSNMTVRAISEQELRVRWIPLQQFEWYGAPQGYKILYRGQECQCPFEESFVYDIAANSHQLVHLEEYTPYEVTVVAVNDIGASAEAPAAVEKTRESVPSAGPSNVTAETTSSTTIVVRWGSVPKIHQNGIIEGYKVVYIGDDLTPSEKVIPENSTFATTLTELKKYFLNSIQVRAFTRLGDGALSNPPILIQTLDDVPGPPSNVSFPDVSYTYARIRWDPPSAPNGDITAYSITYYLVDRRDVNHTMEFGPNVRTYRAKNLKAESNYLFLVRARTRLGWGRILKAPVYTTNNRDLPAPPSRPSISMSQVTAHSITFSWSPGKDGFAPIRYYSAQHSEGDSDSAWHDLDNQIDYSTTSYSATGLQPFSSYKFRIKATNDIGSSEWSERSEAVRTLPAAPVEPPSDVKVIPITRTSVRVEWTPLFPDSWSGDPESGGYVVKYRQISNIPTPFNTERRELENTLARNVVLHDLQRDTNYEIIVVSFNAQGESPPSAPRTVYVGEAVPTGEPRNVNAEATSATDIHITWDPPIEEDRNGELLGYKIFYRQTKDSAGSEEVEVVGPKTQSFELLYLNMYTKYTITLLCFNPAGEGPRSAPVEVVTLESVPGVVSNLTFTDITMSSLKVVWNLPQNPNGKIRGYLVTYETARPDENFSKQVKQKVGVPFLLVQSLKEEVTYKFSVRAETIDLGPEVSASVTTGPQPGSPARPKEVRLSQTVSSLTLHWRNSHPGSSPVLGYYVEVKKKDGETWVVLMKTDSGPSEEYTINYQNLLPSTRYQFRLIAYNVFGISYPSQAEETILTPTKVFMEYGYLQHQPFYHETWFMVTLAAISIVLIIVVVAALCVKSKTYKYKQEVNKTIEESLGPEDFPSYEMQTRGTLSKRSTLNRSTFGRKSTLGAVGGATALVAAKSPPRPAPASVTYSDDETVKGYDENPDDSSSDVTEKPTDISSTDSQASESEAESRHSEPHSFVNHYANVNDTLRQSWKRQKPMRNYSSYTDSEAEGSAVMSLNGGQIIMNNMAGSRAPLPGFSSFV